MRLVYTMDDVNYSGGAHVATLNQVRFVHENLHWPVVILSLAEPSPQLRCQLPFVHFITPGALYAEGEIPPCDDAVMADLLAQLSTDDRVCVPFENSRFRPLVAAATFAWKVQWVHIDYAHWSTLNNWTRQITADDGALYQNFDQIVFISQMSQDGFVSRYPHLADKCHVCHNLMDVERIRLLAADTPENLLFTGQNRLKLVTVARLEDQQKAIGRCLVIAKMLRDEGLNFEWVFVGSGTPQDERLYRQFVRTAGLEAHIFFAGAQQNPFQFVRRADVFCLFSRYEGIPNTIFESMIVGTPVMATRVGATAEQIAPDAGWLVENNTSAILNGLRQLIANPAHIKTTRQNLAGYQYNIPAIQKNIQRLFTPGAQ